MAYGYGQDYGFDPAAIRRSLAAYRAPRPSWDVPDGGMAGDARSGDTAAASPAAPAGAVDTYGGGGTYASTGDPLLDTIRNTTMADAAARILGGRAAAQRAAGDDPSLAAYAGLEGLLVGQGDAAMALNQGATSRLQQMDARKWQEYVLRLQRQWQDEDARNAAYAQLLGGIGGIAGKAGGAWLSPGGLWG